MTVYDMFVRHYTGVGRAAQRELLNKSLYHKLILEIARGDYTDEYRARMLKSIVTLELDKDTPDKDVVAFARKHLEPLMNRVLLKGGLTETVHLELTDAELQIIERALQKELKQR